MVINRRKKLVSKVQTSKDLTLNSNSNSLQSFNAWSIRMGSLLILYWRNVLILKHLIGLALRNVYKLHMISMNLGFRLLIHRSTRSCLWRKVLICWDSVEKISMCHSKQTWLHNMFRITSVAMKLQRYLFQLLLLVKK